MLRLLFVSLWLTVSCPVILLTRPAELKTHTFSLSVKHTDKFSNVISETWFL